MWEVTAWVSEILKSLVTGSLSVRRLTWIWSTVPAFRYQACCRATASMNLSIMPGLMSDRRTTSMFPVHGKGALSFAEAFWGEAAWLGPGLSEALMTMRVRNKSEAHRSVSYFETLPRDECGRLLRTASDRSHGTARVQTAPARGGRPPGPVRARLRRWGCSVRRSATGILDYWTMQATYSDLMVELSLNMATKAS